MDPQDRYSRQRLFAPIGDAGQEKLRAARVTVVGCGALGTHIAQHLVRAGVGFVRIVDRDFVESSNLQRQVLFDETDAREATPKAIAAGAKLERVNSEVVIEPHVADLTAENVIGLVDDVDVVIDGTDNFDTRYLLNDACVSLGKPWVYGGVVASHGMLLTVRPGETACFACVVPEAPAPGSADTCDTAGVIGPAVAIVAAAEVAETLKLLVGDTEALNPGLLTIDVWRNHYRTFQVPRNPGCPVCAGREFRFLRHRAGAASTVLCGRNAVQITPGSPADLQWTRVHERLSAHGPVRYNEHILRFEAEGLELTLFPDGRAVVKGTDEPERARTFYARYIGS